MTRRLKVLISAYACEPGKGSEPGVGWNWVQQIARFHDVWVITRANNRAPIEAALAARPLPGVHWVYYDLPRWARFWKKGGRGVQLYYMLWQIGIYFVARRLHRQHRFDLAHHVTFTNFWVPSYLPLLPVPVILGPLAGADTMPSSFKKLFPVRGRIFEFLRDMMLFSTILNPMLRISLSRTQLALAITQETGQKLKQLGCPTVQVVGPPVALTAEELTLLQKPATRYSHEIRFISIGRFEHWKGFHIGLRAFALFRRVHKSGEYWIVGDGAERSNLEKLARCLDVMGAVKFWGFVPREQEFKLLKQSDVLVHPSFHDPGAWVCVEAMASETPVLCFASGGPNFLVDENCGMKILMSSPTQAVDDLAAAMLQLAADPALRARMGAAGRQRVREHFTWEQKGEQLAELYGGILSANDRQG